MGYAYTFYKINLRFNLRAPVRYCKRVQMKHEYTKKGRAGTFSPLFVRQPLFFANYFGYLVITYSPALRISYKLICLPQ